MRRGQVSIIAAVGLVVLIIVGLVYLAAQAEQPKSQVAQDESQLIHSQVQQCLAFSGESALREIGSQGGYGDLSGLKRTQDQDAQVISVGVQQVPLWHEAQVSPQLKMNNNRPPLCTKNPCPVTSVGERSIQQAIERLTQERITACLANFSATPQLQVRADGAPIVSATIRESDVALILKYPVTLRATNGEEVAMDRFDASLDIRLPQLYRYAQAIQESEQSGAFMENAFLHLLVLYQGVDASLPPFREVRAGVGQKMWVRTRVQQIVEQEILPYMNFLQIVNAQESYAPITAPPRVGYEVYQQGIYDYLAIKIDEEVYPYGTRFEYAASPMYLSINRKELLKPTTLPSGWLMRLVGMGIQDYNFKYTASFPLVVRIQDPAAFGGQGYEFTFGMEANIRNNQPLDLSEPLTTFDFAPTSVNLMDDAQLANHTFSLSVTDRRTGAPIAAAQLSYSCGSEVVIGETDAQGSWLGKLPYCIDGGYVIADHDGFMRDAVRLDNHVEDGQQTSTTVQLWPLMIKRVRLVKKTPTDIVQGTRTALAKNDGILLQIARQKEHGFEEEVPLESALQYGGQTADEIAENTLDAARRALEDAYRNGQLTAEEFASINDSLEVQDSPPLTEVVNEHELLLAPGKYDIQGSLLYSGLIAIPAESRGGVFGIGAAELPAQNFTSWTTGGVLLTGDDGAVLTPEDVYGNGTLVFYVLERPLPRTWADIESASDTDTAIRYERDSLIPTVG